jgi:hypothetical protein
MGLPRLLWRIMDKVLTWVTVLVVLAVSNSMLMVLVVLHKRPWW